MKQSFKPTSEMLKAAETLFLAMAHVAYLKPIVIGYKTQILAENKWKVRPDLAQGPGEEIIVEPNLAYLMHDEDHAKYVALCHLARDAAKLPVDNPEHCPLQVAGRTVVQAEHALINLMVPITKLTVDNLLNSGMANYKKYVDLTLGLFAPFMKTGAAILKDIENGN